jgi:hypothetical protein
MLDPVPVFGRGKGVMGKFKGVRRLPGLIMAVVLVALALAAVAVADTIFADGDGVTPIGNNNMAFAGTLTCGHDATPKNALIGVRGAGSGGGAVFVNDSSVTVDVQGIVVNPLQASAVVTATFAGTGASSDTVSLPSTWDSALQNSFAADTVTSSVKIHPTAPGSGSAVITYRASGTATNGNPRVVTDNMTVTWTASSCDTTAPTSSATAKNADNSDYTFGTWTNQDVTVTLSGQDNTGGSGLKEIRYTTDGSAPTASHGTVYGSAFPISAEGTTALK